MKKLSVILFLISLLVVTACNNKLYGHYEDDKMIGTVRYIDFTKSLLHLDISEWSKRKIKGRGEITLDGVFIKVEITDATIIRREDGTISDIYSLKNGQKVLVNPPESVVAKEVILLEMTYEEKYKHLLSGNKDTYSTTVYWEEGEKLSIEMEEQLRSILPKSTIGFTSYPEDYIVDYKEELNIEKFPVMLVFDNKGLVFKTYEVEKLLKFFDVME